MRIFAKALQSSYSSIYIFILRLLGKKISVGQGTTLSWRAVLVPGSGSISIGKNCYIGDWVVINTYGGDITIGDNVSINYFCVLYGHGGLTIGNDCRIAAHTVIVPTEHNYSRKDILIRKQKNSHRGIALGNDVWVGSNVTILDGSNVSDGCVIGANSVVKGIMDSYGIYVGSPAKKVKEREA